MTTSNFSLHDYLNRIGFNGDVRPDFATLTALMSAQLQCIPFENSTVRAGNIPSLVPHDIYSKLVTSSRGGYCYEVNGLFAIALTAIGFEWYFAGARPMFYPARRPKTHMVVIVTIEGNHYLCDTGFGVYGLREPMKIGHDQHADQNGDRFALTLQDTEYVLTSWVNDAWAPQYGFALIPQEWIEFTLANYFNATSPDAIFTQKKLAVMQTPTGRKILMDNTLKIIDKGITSITDVDYDLAAREHFGLLPL